MYTGVTTIRCLKGLPLAVTGKDSQAYKLLETFCLLKAHFETQGGRIAFDSNWEQVVADAARVNKKTIRRRIPLLLKFEFLQSSTDHCYYIIRSWDDIAEMYGIRHQRFYHIKDSEHVKLEYILREKATIEKEKQGGRACVKRIKANRYLRDIIEPVTGSIHPETVANHQLNNYVSDGTLYADDEVYALNTRYKDKDEQIIRGDTALSYRTLNRLFGYKGHGSYAYWDKKLTRLGLRYSKRRVIDLPRGTNTTNAKRKTRLGFVKYNEVRKRVELIMPNLVIHLPLKGLDERFKQVQALQQHLTRTFQSGGSKTASNG